jgi:hypothetical protein
MENQEITLWELCVKFFNWIVGACRWLGNFFLKCLHLCLRKWWISLPLTVLIVGYGLWAARPSNKWYTAETVAILNGPHVDMVKTMLEPYKKTQKNPKYFAVNNQKYLGVSEEVAKNVQAFETFYVIDCLGDSTADLIDYQGKFPATDTINCRMFNRMAIRVLVHDVSVLEQYEKALLNYLNSDVLLNSAYEYYRQDLQRHSDFCHEQIEVLDSLTREFYFNQSPYAQIQAKRQDLNLLLGKREIVTLHNETLELFRYEQKLDYYLSMCTAPVVLQGHFAVSNKAVNGMLRYGIISLIIAFVLSSLIAACIENFGTFVKWAKKRE